MTTPSSDQHAEDRAALQSICDGYRPVALLFLAVKLGIAEHLYQQSYTADALAIKLNAHAASLHRILRGLALLGVCEELDDGRFSLTPRGALLRKDSEAGFYAQLMLCGQQYFPAWLALEHSAATGQPAFDHRFGMSVWEHRQQEPALNDCFNQWLSHMTCAVVEQIVAAYDFSKVSILADIGGGVGELLSAVLSRYPRLRGVLYEQPHVIDAATAYLAEKGVGDRSEVVVGDFFAAISVEADTLLLKSILHDWSDDKALTILQRCREALPQGGTLLLVERMLPETALDDADTTMLDLHMLAMTGGQERTENAYQTLLNAAGFGAFKVFPTAGPFVVIEAR